MRRLQMVTCLLLAALAPQALAGQLVQAGDQVRLQIRGSASQSYEILRLRGTVQSIDAGRLTAHFRDGPRSMRLDSIIRMDVARERSRASGALQGALIGGITAGAIGFFLGIADPQPDSGPLISETIDSGLFGAAVLGVPGMLVGGLIGLATPGTRWERVIPAQQEDD